MTDIQRLKIAELTTSVPHNTTSNTSSSSGHVPSDKRRRIADTHNDENKGQNYDPYYDSDNDNEVLFDDNQRKHTHGSMPHYLFDISYTQ